MTLLQLQKVLHFIAFMFFCHFYILGGKQFNNQVLTFLKYPVFLWVIFVLNLQINPNISCKTYFHLHHFAIKNATTNNTAFKISLWSMNSIHCYQILEIHLCHPPLPSTLPSPNVRQIHEHSYIKPVKQTYICTITAEVLWSSFDIKILMLRSAQLS